MARRSYSDAERAEALAVLDANAGNVERTARHLGLPRKTLEGWDGDTTFWRAENGTIVGETTPEKVVKVNNFLIWRGGTVKDFELKVEFRINGTNSGAKVRLKNGAPTEILSPVRTSSASG